MTIHNRFKLEAEDAYSITLRGVGYSLVATSETGNDGIIDGNLVPYTIMLKALEGKVWQGWGRCGFRGIVKS